MSPPGSAPQPTRRRWTPPSRLIAANRERALWSTAGLLVGAALLCFVWVRAVGPLPGELRFEAWRAGGGVPVTLTPSLTFVTYLGDPWVAIGTVVILVAVAVEECGRRQAVLILAAAGVVAFASLMQAILGPTSQEYKGAAGASLGPGDNFPSAHSAYAVSVFGMASWLMFRRGRRALSYALALPVVLMGPALALLGNHYPADVLAGYAVGLAWLIAVLLVGQQWARRQEDHRGDVALGPTRSRPRVQQPSSTDRPSGP